MRFWRACVAIVVPGFGTATLPPVAARSPRTSDRPVASFREMLTLLHVVAPA